MSIYNDFLYEIETQEGIIRYVEVCCFEEEYNKTYNILELPLRDMGDIYEDNVEFIDELRVKCKNVQDSISVQYKTTDPLPDWVSCIDQREPLGELIEHCIDCLEENGQIDASEIEKDAEMANKQNSYILYTKEDIKKAISVVPTLYSLRENETLDTYAENIERLMATLDMLDVRLNTNIYRQSFISLFSIFDAYVFDYMKKYFMFHTNEVEEFFHHDTKLKIPFEEVFVSEDIQTLKSNLIDQRFDGKYIKQILMLIKDHKPSVFNGIAYNKIMETVNRRNIHIHNRGFADARYVENFNNDGLDIGDYAQISKQYFLDSVSLLKRFIQNLEIEYK